jgi:hypothetical protein
MHCPITLEALEAESMFLPGSYAMNLAEAQTMRDAAKRSEKRLCLPSTMGLKGDYAMRQLQDEV